MPKNSRKKGWFTVAYLTQRDVLSGPTKPLYYVYEDGSVEKL